MPSQKSKERILIVDDSQSTLELLQRNLTTENYQVFSASGVTEAVEVLENTAVDLVITDLKMPKISGLDLVRHVRENYHNTEVVMITGYASIEGAVNAVKSGVEDYLPKPFTDQELLTTVHHAIEKLKIRRLEQTNKSKITTIPGGLIGQSKAMQKI